MVQRALRAPVEARKLVDEAQKDDNYKIGQATFLAKNGWSKPLLMEQSRC